MEKERYELQEVFEEGSFHWNLKDNDTKSLKPLVNLYNCVNLLNQQDARIKVLEDMVIDRIGQLYSRLNEINDLQKENEQLKQSQHQKAIEELEKIIDFIRNADKKPEYWDISQFIDSQIKELS